MGIWSGLDTAQTFEKGTFLKEGKYTLRIKRCLDKTTRKSGQAFIAEFEVLASSNTAAHPIGSTVSWFQKLSDKAVAFPAIKAFLAAVYKYDLRDKARREEFEAKIAPSTPTIMDRACDEGQNMLKGQTVDVEVTQVTTQKGLPFSRHDFTPSAAQ